jgi:hypothetical protein
MSQFPANALEHRPALLRLVLDDSVKVRWRLPSLSIGQNQHGVQ